MFSKLYNYYLIARESLFYVPSLVCLLYAVTCFLLFWVDQVYDQEFQNVLVLFNGGLEDAQKITGILLSSMITLAVLVISITMIVLSLSASQLGPRIIRIFMTDRMTKIYIGLLFGSIAACFVLIGLLHEAQNSQLVPRLTVSSVFMACFLNLFVLLAYVQHVARLSIADNIISKIHVSIKNSIERIKEQDKAQASGAKKNSWPKDFEQKSRCMYASQSGYIQIIDYETLKDLAEDHKFQIQLHVSAGDFIIQGAEVASLTPKSRGSGDLEKEIEATIVYGQTRTGSQDIEYSVRHLVEIGLRALSPGINDHYTAIAVLNKLSDSLARLFKKELPERIYCDAKGKILLKGRKDSKRDIVFEALSSIRNAGQTKPDILAHLIINLKRLKKMAERAEEKNAIEQQLVYIKDHISHNFGESEEGKYLLKIYG